MLISCHFRDRKALLFESGKQRYNKYSDLYLFTFLTDSILRFSIVAADKFINYFIFVYSFCFQYSCRSFPLLKCLLIFPCFYIPGAASTVLLYFAACSA